MILYQQQKITILVDNIGLTLLDMEDYILSLTEKDLIKGPVTDRDYPEDSLFIFKKENKEILKGIVFYIKIKEKNGQIKILSFHEDEN